MAKAEKTIKKQETCKYPHKKLWCITGMSVAIIVLVLVSNALWSKIVVTILAALIFIRSMMVNCCE